MPKVLNIKDFNHEVPVGAVYVGRPSKWGNPFTIKDPLLPCGLSKEEEHRVVVGEYRKYILNNPVLMSTLPELKGKDLVCYCAPLPCHADILLELANKKSTQQGGDK